MTTFIDRIIYEAHEPHVPNHESGCNCSSCKSQAYETDEEFSWLADLFGGWSKPKPSLPQNPPLKNFNLLRSNRQRKAVAYNSRNKTRIGWDKYKADITRKVLKLTYTPDDQAFAQAVANWQKAHNLSYDGKLGHATWARMKTFLRPGAGASRTAPSRSSSSSLPYQKVFPMPLLPDGRRPLITSRHWRENPSRAPRPASHPKGAYAGHQGVDIMYRYDASTDPPASELKSKKRINRNRKYWMPESIFVRAFASGKVYRVRSRSNGYYLKIIHPDGLQTTYRHLTQPIVQEGDTVQAGQKIARLSKLGNPAHLHFEIRKKGRYRYRQSVNPRPYIQNLSYLSN